MGHVGASVLLALVEGIPLRWQPGMQRRHQEAGASLEVLIRQPRFVGASPSNAGRPLSDLRQRRKARRGRGPDAGAAGRHDQPLR